jgi:hypothetical protein
MTATIKYYKGAFLKYALVADDGKILCLRATAKGCKDYAKAHDITVTG